MRINIVLKSILWYKNINCSSSSSSESFISATLLGKSVAATGCFDPVAWVNTPNGCELLPAFSLFLTRCHSTKSLNYSLRALTRCVRHWTSSSCSDHSSLCHFVWGGRDKLLTEERPKLSPLGQQHSERQKDGKQAGSLSRLEEQSCEQKFSEFREGYALSHRSALSRCFVKVTLNSPLVIFAWVENPGVLNASPEGLRNRK